jgi:hypothetical protein
MRSPRKQPVSSPRFPRGLELALWLAGSLLLAYGLTRSHTDKKNVVETAPVPAIQPRQQQLAPRFNQDAEWVHIETPQESFLKDLMARIQSEENMDKREELITSLVDSIAKTDIQSMLNDLQELGKKNNQCELADDLSQRLIHRWAQSDAPSASAYVQQLSAGQMRQSALSGVAIEWANTNLNDAVVWARQLPDLTEQNAVLLTIANEAVRVDPVESLRLAANLPRDNQRDELIRHAAMEWASKDAEQAVSWARQIGDVQLRSQVLMSVATTWSETDPVSAATLAATEIPEGRDQSDAVIGIIERWAQQQPEVAAAWVEQFPAGALRTAAVENLIVQWSLLDATKAKQWLAEHS